MLYLIMECKTLSDQWECDADRTPIVLTENWETYYHEHKEELSSFEVYSWDGAKFSLIKEYDDPMEYGMGLWYWTKEEWEQTNEVICSPHVVKKWPGVYNRATIPDEICELIYNNPTYNYYGEEEEPDNWLAGCGYINWYDKDGNYWVYGEYDDNHYATGL